MNNSEVASHDTKLSELFERIFLFTLNPNYANSNIKCVYIGESSDISLTSDDETLLRPENLDGLLLQRLMLTDRNLLEERVRPSPAQSSCTKTSRIELKCIEQLQLNYLFDSFRRLHDTRALFTTIHRSDMFSFTSNLITNVCRTLLNILDYSSENTPCEPADYFTLKNNPKYHSDLAVQMLLLTSDNLNTSSRTQAEQFYDEFIHLFDDSIKIDQINIKKIPDETELANLLQLDSCELKFLNNLFIYLNRHLLNLSQFEDYSSKYVQNFELIKFLAKTKLMKFLFVFNSFPSDFANGRNWQTATLLGKFLTPHCLPIAMPTQKPNPLMPTLTQTQLSVEYRYFTEPSHLTKRDIEINEKNVWQIQSFIRKEQLGFFFEFLLRKNSGKLVRDLWLRWLGECVNANRKKAQEWQGYMQNNEHLAKFASDGFFLNVLDLVLEYSMPFCQFSYSNKLLKINYLYSKSANSHFQGFDQETKLTTRLNGKRVRNVDEAKLLWQKGALK